MTNPAVCCPVCASPDYGFLFDMPARTGSLFHCRKCGHIALSNSKVPTEHHIRSYLNQMDQGALLEKVRQAETDMAAHTGDRSVARTFFDPIYAWYRRGLAGNYAALVYHDTEQASPEIDGDVWALFKDRMLRFPGYLAPNTLKAYASDFRKFRDWCRSQACFAVPAAGEDLADYVKHRGASVRPATIKRELAAISMVHKVSGVYDPTDHIEVKMAITEQVRINGLRPVQKAAVRHQIVQENSEVAVDQLINACSESLLGLRDRALLSVGMDAGVRGSELVKLKVEDFRVKNVMKDGHPTIMHQVFIAKSKTDQKHLGSWRLISSAAYDHTVEWLDAAGISSGHVFRAVYRGTVNSIRDKPISERSYRAVIKRVAVAAGLPRDLISQLSTHSLRIGAVQQLSAQGANLGDVMRAFDMTDVRTAARYAEGLDLASNPQFEVVRRRTIAKS